MAVGPTAGPPSRASLTTKARAPFLTVRSKAMPMASLVGPKGRPCVTAGAPIKAQGTRGAFTARGRDQAPRARACVAARGPARRGEAIGLAFARVTRRGALPTLGGHLSRGGPPRVAGVGAPIRRAAEEGLRAQVTPLPSPTAAGRAIGPSAGPISRPARPTRPSGTRLGPSLSRTQALRSRAITPLTPGSGQSGA